MTTEPGEITLLLRRCANEDDEEARERLYRLVEPELRQAARQRLRRNSAEPLLQTTLLIDEAFMRLVLRGGPRDAHDRSQCENHRHFYRAATRVMRNLRIDVARWRLRQPGALIDEAEPPDGWQAPAGANLETEELLLAIDAALIELAKVNRRAVAAFELRYFGDQVLDLGSPAEGARLPSPLDRPMRYQEVADVLGVSVSTAHRFCQQADDFIRPRLSGFYPGAREELSP